MPIPSDVHADEGLIAFRSRLDLSRPTNDQRNMLVSKQENACKLVIGENTTLLVLGGEPFQSPRFIDWNFVSSSKEKIAEAKSLWQQQQFKMVPEEVGFVPLPKILGR